MSASIELALVPLDRARVRVLHWAMPLSSWLAGAREARVAVIGASVLLFAALGTLVAPLWLLALGPIVLGVPHLLADLRYCVVRQGWQREKVLWLTAALPLLAVGLGAGFELGLLGVAASVLGMPGDLRRRVAVALLASGLALATWRWPTIADLSLAHAHNFVAVALWASWRERRTRLHAIPIVAFAAVVLALSLGLGDASWDAGWITAGLPEGLGRSTQLRTLAPGVPAPFASRLVLLFCFAQAVHYGVWLRMVPEEDRYRPTPRSFAASYRALRAELHPLILVAVALAAVGLAVWACVDLVAARSGYFRFARFHGSLELIAAGLLIAGGRRARAGRRA